MYLAFNRPRIRSTGILNLDTHHEHSSSCSFNYMTCSLQRKELPASVALAMYGSVIADIETTICKDRRLRNQQLWVRYLLGTFPPRQGEMKEKVLVLHGVLAICIFSVL